jgi:predicted transcriptional regulator
VSERISRKRRDKFAILAEILKQSKIQAKKTHIMHNCNLSFRQLRYYLRFMRLKGLIRRKKMSETVVYQTTENGEKFLNAYSKIVRLLQT